MIRLLSTVASVLVLLSAAALAQQPGNPAGMTPGTGPHQPNIPDRLFVRTVAIGGMAEVELGKLAEQKGQSEAVKDFGRRMIEDHGQANERLIGLAKADGLAVPQELDGEQTAMRDRLESLSGAEFDLAYLQGQVVEHQKAVQLLEYEIGSGQDVELKNFAAEILPAVLHHLRSAQDLQAEMSGKAH
jgi:putative membrane protein